MGTKTTMISQIPETETATMQESTATPDDAEESEGIKLDLVDSETADILKNIYDDMSKGNLDMAANTIIDSYDKLSSLWNDVFRGQLYVFDGSSFIKLNLNDDLVYSGFVLIAPETVFYGKYKNALPEGDMIAISAYTTDAKRYDYVEGYFKSGYMSGEGETGYKYFDDTITDEKRQVEKTGVFNNDLMDGAFTYQVTDKDGSAITWDMISDMGKTDISNWEYDDKTGVYRLSARDREANKYEITASEATEERWRNNVVWPR